MKKITCPKLGMPKISIPNLIILILSIPILGIPSFGGSGIVTTHSTLRLVSGYVYRVHCQGRLLASAIGDDRVVKIEALPKEMGCGAILKPTQTHGTTNLIVETTTGSEIRVIDVVPGSARPAVFDLYISGDKS